MSDAPRHRLRWQGRVSGPFPIEIILSRLDAGQIGIYHEIEHNDAWTSLQEFLKNRDTPRPTEIHSPPIPPKPVVQPPSTNTGNTVGPGLPPPPPPPRLRSKSRSVFVISGLLLGFLGIHNFYAGYWGTAVIQLLATIVLSSLGFGIIFTWIWAMIELLVVHSDARGTRMS